MGKYEIVCWNETEDEMWNDDEEDNKIHYVVMECITKNNKEEDVEGRQEYDEERQL